MSVDERPSDLGRRRAAAVVEQALAAVFDPAAVGGLREDSPLSALGTTDADAVCIADAIAEAADAAGWACVLDDQAMQGAQTVADLIDAVLQRAESTAEAAADTAPEGTGERH